MNLTLLKEFFAGFLRTRHIARHFRRLAMLDSVTDASVSFLGIQTLRVAAQRAEQLHRTAVGGNHQGLRQCRRHFAADAGVGHAIEHRQAAMTGESMPVEKFAQQQEGAI
jgi:Mg2+-importing ATPase